MNSEVHTGHNLSFTTLAVTTVCMRGLSFKQTFKVGPKRLCVMMQEKRHSLKPLHLRYKLWILYELAWSCPFVSSRKAFRCFTASVNTMQEQPRHGWHYIFVALPPLNKASIEYGKCSDTKNFWLSSNNYFREGQNLLLCRFLLLC